MSIFREFRALNREQRAAFLASLLGWTLDAFDFFLLVFVVRSIASDFHAEVKAVAYAITLTLMLRPLGAFVFGWLADRFGRKPVLMADVLLYSFFELCTAFAPSLTALLVCRACFGFAMGGEWGVGASLVMETIPARSRGIISGVLQEGYALGYLLAAVVYGLFYDRIGWRGMFVIGTLPAVLVLYLRTQVKESPTWKRTGPQAKRVNLFAALRGHWGLFAFAIVMMFGFNSLSHGTQDLYPTLLQVQHGLSTHTVSLILIAANLGAITGGILFGLYSDRVGRRRAIVTAALLVLPIAPLWALASTPLLLGLGAFLVQLAVQGAWGVVPVHLNELSPGAIRATFPGFTYQLGNLLASSNAVLQAGFAERHGGNYGLALAATAVGVALFLALVVGFGPEAKGIAFGGSEPA